MIYPLTGSSTKSLYCQYISNRPKAANLSLANRRSYGSMPKLFPGMDIRKMYLYTGDTGPCDSVSKRIAVMGERPGVDHNPVRTTLLNIVNNRALVVRLKKREAYIPGFGFNLIVYLVQSQCTVDPGLPFAQHVQVRAVYNCNMHLKSSPKARLL